MPELKSGLRKKKHGMPIINYTNDRRGFVIQCINSNKIWKYVWFRNIYECEFLNNMNSGTLLPSEFSEDGTTRYTNERGWFCVNPNNYKK